MNIKNNQGVFPVANSQSTANKDLSQQAVNTLADAILKAVKTTADKTEKRLQKVENGKIQNSNIINNTPCLIGDTKTIKPTKVVSAIKAGQNVLISHQTSNFGNVLFSFFVVLESGNAILSSGVAEINNELGACQLGGDLINDEWVFHVYTLAEKSEIPVNPEDIGALGSKDTAANASKLGGKTPDQYLGVNGTAANSSKLGGKAPEYYIQLRNLLVNSYFTNPVNQRGLTQLTGLQGTTHTYGLIDRWLCYGSGTVFTVEDGYIKAVNNGSATCGIVQRVESSIIRAGKKYTLACKATVGASARLSYGAGLNVHTHQIDLNAANEIHTLTFTASESTDGAHIVRLCTLANAQTFKVEWMALYEGEYTADTLPPYVPKGYIAELAECQRYFVRIGGNAYTHIGLAHAQNETQILCSVGLPQPMREGVVPTLIKGGGLNMTAKAGTTFKNISAIGVNQVGVSALLLTLTSENLTKGSVFDVYVPSGSWLDISVDL